MEVDSVIDLPEGTSVVTSYTSDYLGQIYTILSNDDYFTEQSNNTRLLAMFEIGNKTMTAGPTIELAELGLDDREGV